MDPKNRSAIARWVLGIATLAAASLLWPGLQGLGLMDWLLRGSLVLLIGLTWNLGVKVSFGQVTFLPAVALMAYMALGRETGMAVLIAGVVLGGLGYLAQYWQAMQNQYHAWWVTLGEALMWPLARNGLSLLAADWAYRALGSPPPLRAITSLQDMSPVLAAPVTYLIVYDLLLFGDLWLQGVEVVPTLVKNRRVLLGTQLLPLVPIPFSALVLSNQGIFTFFIFELILLTIMIVINRLTHAQAALNIQVSQLRAFSAMNRALRTTLEKSNLLETTYYQIANLLNLKNLHIVLSENPGAADPQWKLAYAVENGRQITSGLPEQLDGFTKRVLQEGASMLADPVEQTARKLKIDTPPAYARAWMAVPLIASKRMLGCMYTWLAPEQEPGRSFDNSELNLLAAVAGQTSVALENALLFEAAQNQASQLARLNEISTVMNASLRPERVLELIADSIVEVAGCDKAAIYLIQTDSHTPEALLAHAKGFNMEHLLPVRKADATLTESEYKRVFTDCEALVVPDIQDEKVKPAPGTLLLADRAGFASYAYLPLRAQKQSIGMLAVFYDQPHFFPEGEVEVLETFANQAALAVVNARIYQRVDIQLARRVEQIVQMADINRRLSATLDMETIFDLIIDTAMEGCNAGAGVLVLSQDPDTGIMKEGLNMVAWRGFDPAKTSRAPHHVAEGLADRVLESGETILATVDDPDDAHGPRSQLSVPITVENRTIGAIAMESEVLNAFSEDDVTFVSQLAVQASVAIRNAQLYRRAQAVRDRLHAILDASTEGLLMIDPQSRIVMTNTRMGDFWDFARQDFMQRTPDQFLADPLTALGEGLGYREGELSALLQQGLRSPNMQPKTDLYAARGGSRTRFVERMATPVYDEHAHFIGLLLVFRDVTEQKELEEAREDLTSMIVHDLRAPLQAVMGGMRLVQDRVSKEDEIITQATDVSSRAVKKLLNLVNNLLDLSRQESGELAIEQSIEDMGAILEDVTKDLMPLAQEVNAVVKVEVPDDLPYTYIDRDMIERVVLNVVDNALKYTPPGGLVTIHAARDPDGDMVRVQTIDTGPGVPDDFKDKIFDRFAQVPGQKGRRRSAGLGLAFCRLAIEAHGGQIWVEDNPGGGSVFNFTVPISKHPPEAENGKEAPDKAAKAQETKPKSGGKKRTG